MYHSSVLKKSAALQRPHERHRPEKTRLYRIIDRYYPEFRAYMAEQGRSLPYHVQKEFDEYLKCGRLEHGFLRIQCSTCHHEQLRSAVNDGVSVPVAVPDAWLRVLPCW